MITDPKKRLGTKIGRKVFIDDPRDFVGSVDGITFGSSKGRLFDTMHSNSMNKDKINWAKAQSLFLKQVVNTLDMYAMAIENMERNNAKDKSHS